MSQMFKEHLSKHGISHETTVPKNPEQNGTAERMNRTLMESVRSMLTAMNVENLTPKPTNAGCWDMGSQPIDTGSTLETKKRCSSVVMSCLMKKELVFRRRCRNQSCVKRIGLIMEFRNWL